MNSYNGYTTEEREKKLRALHRLYPKGSNPHPYYTAPCHLCGRSDGRGRTTFGGLRGTVPLGEPGRLCRLFPLSLPSA